MKTRNILSMVALILGEAIIITSFLLWGNDVPIKQNITNIIITSIVYGLIFIDVFKPWINLKEPSHKSAGSMGTRWMVTGIYSLLAITMVICSYIFSIPFNLLIIIHLSLLALLILGFSAVLHTSDKVNSVYSEETEQRQPLLEMKAAFTQIKELMEESDKVNPTCMEKMESIEEALRYLSPSNNPEARILENQFIEITNKVQITLSTNPSDSEKILALINKIEQICKKRKAVYSI